MTYGRERGNDTAGRGGDGKRGAYDGGWLWGLDRETVGLDWGAGTGCFGLLVVTLDLFEALASPLFISLPRRRGSVVADLLWLS